MQLSALKLVRTNVTAIAKRIRKQLKVDTGCHLTIPQSTVVTSLACLLLLWWSKSIDPVALTFDPDYVCDVDIRPNLCNEHRWQEDRHWECSFLLDDALRQGNQIHWLVIRSIPITLNRSIGNQLRGNWRYILTRSVYMLPTTANNTLKEYQFLEWILHCSW